MIAQVQPNLILLDVMLPGIDGLEICRQVRARHEIPVIRPFAAREFIARVRAILRRTVTTEKAVAQRTRQSPTQDEHTIIANLALV